MKYFEINCIIHTLFKQQWPVSGNRYFLQHVLLHII